MTETPNIVQVHLGRTVPEYLYDQLRQTRVFNPTVPIWLILDDGTPYDEVLVHELAVFVVRKGRIRESLNHQRFLRRNRLKKRGLDGFWLFASERFFVMESFLAAFELRNIFHLENDVMLYARLDDLLPICAEQRFELGMTMDSERRCIPGIVFIRDRKSLERLNAHIVSNSLKRKHTDMEALASFMAVEDAGHCASLPVVPSGYPALFPLMSAAGRAGTSPWYARAFGAFGGVFDAAALGQYLGGIDTRGEDRDTTGFVNETAVYDPRNFNLHWKVESGLRRPYGTVGGLEFPVFNLHIHSKNLTEFSSVIHP